MRVAVRILLITLVGIVPSVASAQVAHLYGVGDLPGGPFISVVRDATKHDGVIYAVGASAQNPQVLCFPTPTPGCLNQSQFSTDTPVLWKFDGTTATLIALPSFAGNNTTANNNVVASAITRDATYVASQARFSSTNAQFQAMRVTVTPGGFTDPRNLATLIPALPANTSAATVSENGLVLYGTQGLAGATRATRFDVTAGTTSVIPLLPGTTNNQPAIRGSSSTVTFTVPDGPGVYEVRLFRNDTPTLLATSGAITIAATTLAVNGVMAPGGIAVGGGAALTVNVTNGPGQPGDWLVLADTSAAPGTYVAWKYLSDSQHASALGPRDGHGHVHGADANRHLRGPVAAQRHADGRRNQRRHRGRDHDSRRQRQRARKRRIGDKHSAAHGRRDEWAGSGGRLGGAGENRRVRRDVHRLEISE